jgi:membrane protease YdiL (CAAX protease family)
MKFICAQNNPVDLATQESKGHKLIVEILLFLAVFLVASIAQGMVLAIPESIAILTSDAFREMFATGRIDLDAITALVYDLPAWFYVITLLSTGVLIVAVLLYCRQIEKRSLRSIGVVRKGWVVEYLFGLVMGLVLMAAAVGISYGFGAIRFFPAENSRWWMVILLFLGFLVQGMSEELLCRGYLCVSIARRYPRAVAVGVSAALFALLHAANNGLSLLALFNLFLFGILAGIYFLWRGNIWGIAAIHSMWNFAQGNLFGIPVSGSHTGDSVLSCVLIPEMELWNGGTFGLEGGLAVTLVLLVAISALLLIHLTGTKQKACI